MLGAGACIPEAQHSPSTLRFDPTAEAQENGAMTDEVHGVVVGPGPVGVLTALGLD